METPAFMPGRTSIEVQSSSGQAVFIVGEAGIGKSRLLLEFRRQVEAAGARWLVGRCVSYGHDIAYLPMLDVVRDITGIQESDAVATLLTRVETAVHSIGADLSWTVPLLRTMLSLDPGDPEVTAMVPAQRRGRLAEALRALFLGMSQHQPLVLFVEDLHWIDPYSEEVIRVLLEGMAAAPVLVLLTHRPGYTPPFGEQSYYTRLTLRRLPEAQTHAMVERVLQSAEIPPAVLALMARRAEGNPLFIEELCNMLRENGALQPVDGAYQLAYPLDEAAIPATIQGVITARLDRLPEAAKAALQVASVIGREFTARLLERVSAMEHLVTQVLGELRAVELIYEKTIVPELAYMFRHALTHDVAYDSLLRQRRRQLHCRVGEVIEDLYPERLAEFYETLAWHYVQGALWPKAVAYLLKAAQKARDQYAYPEATRACTEALDILDQHGGTRDTLMQTCELLGDLQNLQGHVEPANQAYDRALDIADTPAARRRMTNKRHRPATVVRDRATIAYYEHGSGEPTLVLIHPMVYGLGSFQPLLELLCQDCRIVTIDPRGVGGSDALPGEYLMRDHAADVRAVIEAIGNRPVVAAGISRGGTVAVNFTARYPQLVEKLILIGTSLIPASGLIAPDAPVPSDAEIQQWLQQFITMLRAGDYEQAMQLFRPRIHSEPGCRSLIEGFIRMSRETSPKNAGKPRRSRRGWIGVGRAGLNAQAANIFLCHSGALNGRWSGEDGNPGIHAGEDVHKRSCEASLRPS